MAKTLRIATLSLCLALSFVAGPTQARAEGAPTCDELYDAISDIAENDATEAANRGWLGSLWGRIFKDEGDTPFANIDEGHPYRMTVKSGNALFVDCTAGLINVVYYPVGLVVKARLSFEYKGVQRIFAESEHGLHLIISTDDLQAIGPDDAFFVGTGFSMLPLCLGGKTTSGECDPFREHRPDQPRMHGSSGYLHRSTAGLAKLERKRKLAEHFQSAMVYAESPQEFDAVVRQFDARGDRAALCEVIDEAALYRNGARPGDEPAYEAITFSLCARRGSGAGSQPTGKKRPDASWKLDLREMRIVTREAAREIFRDMDEKMGTRPRYQSFVFQNASFLNILMLKGGAAGAATGVVARTRRKECGDIFTQEYIENIEAGLKASLGSGPLSAEIEYALAREQTLASVSQADRMFHRTAVLVVENQNEPGERRSIASLHDVTIHANCAESAPGQLRKIEMRHPGAVDRAIEIDAMELEIAYERQIEAAKEEGLKIDAQYGIPADSVLRSYWDLGKIWRLKDHNEYVLWRNALRTAFRAQYAVTGPFIDGMKTVEKMRILDHYVHSLMAAIFSSDVPVTDANAPASLE